MIIIKNQKYDTNFDNKYECDLELAASVYTGHLVFTSTTVVYKSGSADYVSSILMFFGYANATNAIIEVSKYFAEVDVNNENSMFRFLRDRTIIENNIFGYEKLEYPVILVRIPPEMLFYNISTVDNTETLISSGDVLHSDSLLKQNHDILKTNKYYSMDYRLRVRFTEYDEYNSHANKIIDNPNPSDQRAYFVQKILYGRVITLKFKLCHEYCETCQEFGPSYDDQKCVTCLPQYFYDYWYYQNVHVPNCVPEGYFNDLEDNKLVKCNSTNSNFYLNLTDNKRICFKRTYRCPSEYPYLNTTTHECLNITVPIMTTIITTIPTTILTTIPTTVITTVPTTTVTTIPTTIVTTIPTTIVTTIPTTTVTTIPTTIVTTIPTTTVTTIPTTILTTIPTTTVTTIPTTILTTIPTTILTTIPTTIVTTIPTTTVTTIPTTILTTIPTTTVTTIPTTTVTTIPTTILTTIPTTTVTTIPTTIITTIPTTIVTTIPTTIITTIPTTIVTTIPTTIITTIPTTIFTTTPTTTITTIPTTTITTIPTTIFTTTPTTTITTTPTTTITTIPTTTITTIPTTTITTTPTTIITTIPTTIITTTPTTIITTIPTTIITTIPTTTITTTPTTTITTTPTTTITTTPSTSVTTTPTTTITTTPTTIITTIPTTTPTKTVSSTIITTVPEIIPSTTIPEIEPTIYKDKCLNGTLIIPECRNLTDEDIYDRLKEEVLASYASDKQLNEYNGNDYSLKVGTSKAEKLINFTDSKTKAADLGDCEGLLKRANNIPDELDLIIIKTQKISNDNDNFYFDVIDPITYKVLNMSICENTTIDIYVPLDLSEDQEKQLNSIVDQGYDPLDLNDKFYREICTPYNSENGTDVLLDDREEFIYSSIVNETSCPEGCGYSTYSLDSKYIKCECDVNSTYVTLDVKHISGENIYLSFLSTFKSSNYKVMRCYNLVFNFTIFCHNYGSILALICFVLYFLFMLYYAHKGIAPLKVKISKIIFDEAEEIAELEQQQFEKMKKEGKIKFKEKNIRRKSSKKGKKGNYPPKKNNIRNLKIDDSDGKKNTEEFVLVDDKKRKRGSKKQRKILSRIVEDVDEISDIPQIDIKEEEKTTKNINNKVIINKNKKQAKEEHEKIKNKNLDNFELNNLDYDEACELDKRGLCKTYWSILMREHTFLFTFFACYDYNLFYIKIERFFILICTQCTINGLFFVHDSMHRKYVEGKELTFVEKLPQYLFTLIGSHIIEVLLCWLGMTDTLVYEIKALPKDQKKSEKVLDVMDKMKRKLNGFFVFTFILFLFYWYFISAFCAVYQNTQIIFLRDSGVSIITSYIDPFIIYGFTTILRLISLSLCCKKKLGCVYKFSDIIPIF